MLLVCGVDPGITGGFALLRDGKVVNTAEMPCFVVHLGFKGRRRKWIDVPKVIKLLEEWGPHRVYLEQQFPMPRQGASSTFTTAFNYGALCAAMFAGGFEHKIVHARQWRPAVGANGHDKLSGQKLATKLWPQHAAAWHGRKHGVSDAALIGYYGHLLSGGKEHAEHASDYRVNPTGVGPILLARTGSSLDS